MLVRRFVPVMLAMALVAGTAHAYEVKNVHAPELRFRVSKEADGKACVSAPARGASDVDACECSLSTDYPQAAGMKDQGLQAALNKRLFAAAKANLCKGEPLPRKSPKAEQPQQANSEYRIHAHGPKILSIMFEKALYTGGAHAAQRAEGLSIDMKTGKDIAQSQIFPNPDKVNAFIERALMTRAAGKQYTVDYRKTFLQHYQGTFLRGETCEDCTVTLTPEGARVIFHPAAVAPYVDGYVEINVPFDLLSPDLRNRLSQ